MEHSPTPDSFDVVVIGGGITGLAQTVALAAAGIRVACIDPQPASPARPEALDGRTTALLQGAVRALDRLGVWADCQPASAPLRLMRIVDEAGRPKGRPLTATFDSADAGEGPFGHNVPNAALRRSLLTRLADLPSGTHIAGTTAETLHFAPDAATVGLSDGHTLRASLVVGADGKGSPTRGSARIKARRWGYGQTAMAFSVAHTRPHGEVSTEFHRPTGPFVLVPLPGNRSSVVWVDSDSAAERFLALDKADFIAAVQKRTRGVLGEITDVGPRGSYAATSLIADNYVARRVALIGEAAHAMPPIGAQGLNLGLTDVCALAEHLIDAHTASRDLGSADVLKAYEAERRPDVLARVFAVDALNRAVQTRLPPMQALRHAGLSLVDRLGPVKARLMRQGMAPIGRVPALMRAEGTAGAVGREPAEAPAAS